MNTKQKLEKLQNAQIILGSDIKWTKDYYAKDAYGQHCEPNDPEATRWCAHGAIFLINETDDEEAEENFILSEELDRVSEELFSMPSSIVNDMLGFDAVHELYDTTIERLQKQLEED